jgi:hypothetical protein
MWLWRGIERWANGGIRIEMWRRRNPRGKSSASESMPRACHGGSHLCDIIDAQSNRCFMIMHAVPEILARICADLALAGACASGLKSEKRLLR